MKGSKLAKHQLVPLIVADVFQLAGAFRDEGEGIANKVGQTQARWQVLSAASAEPKTVPQIARRLGVTRQGVQRLANALIENGSAMFRDNADHKGSPHLVLTTQGRATLARLTKAAEAYHRAIADQLKLEELSAVHEGLRRLLAVLSGASVRNRSPRQSGKGSQRWTRL